MIAHDAAAALDRTRAFDAPHPAPPPAHVRRLRARVARDVAGMLGVPIAHVVVTDDPARRYGGQPWHLVTVHDPDDPDDPDEPDEPHHPDDPDDPATVYRFVPEPSLGGLYHLLDECPDCNAPSVPMTSVAGLADLGRYLAATRPIPEGEIDPDDGPDDRPELPAEFFGDPGHRSDCTIGQRYM